MPGETYRFFNRCYSVSSDSGEFLAAFRAAYRHFSDTGEATSPETILIDPGAGGRRPGIRWNTRFYPAGEPFSPREAAAAAASLIVSRAPAHHVFHGGVVSRGDSGIIICGHASCGKTTLILELLRRGCSFLSDELAPMRRDSGLLEPFPRALHVSPASLELFPGLAPATAHGEGHGDILLDIEDLPWKQRGSACRPSAVVFLHPPGGMQEPERYVEVAAGYAPAAFPAALLGLEGVEGVRKLCGHDLSLFRIRVERGAKLVPAVEKLCREHGVPLVYALRGRSAPPDWNAAPRLRALPASEGLLELARMQLAASRSAVLEKDFAGRTGELLAEMSRLAGGIRFYELSPGKLREMGEAVEQLAAAS